MDRSWIIDGEQVNGEAELRKFAQGYTRKGSKAFKVDFRLANASRTRPLSEVIDLLEANGADIQEL